MSTTVNTNKSKIVTEIMKFSFNHRAFYCYLGMSLWIFILITVMYKYISVGEETVAVKKVAHTEYISKSDAKFRKLYHRACNPPEHIVRGSEGLVDNDAWLLQGVLVVTRHGDRGPLTHLKDGDKLPCDTTPPSALLKGFEEWVANASTLGRAPWVTGPGPFHNFPSLATRTKGTHCALGQLTPKGSLQMLAVGNILREAYKEKLGLDGIGKTEDGSVVLVSTRYRRTFQSLVGAAWGAWREGAGARAARAREAHSVAFCFRDCACHAHHALDKKINSQAKNRLESHPAIKDLVVKLTHVLFESQENPDVDVVRDALLAYMCHDAPMPCTQKLPKKSKTNIIGKIRKVRNAIPARNLFNVDVDNMELDYSQLGFDIDIGKKARDIIGKYDKDKQKTPLDFDAQMEKEKLHYYQQRYLDNADPYEDIVIIRSNLDGDFNFQSDSRIDADFDEDYKEPTSETPEDFCIKKEHVLSLFAYLEWSYKQEIRNVHNRRRGLLVAYGLIHNIVHNMIKMISENKPKFVLYSGHDKTVQALILALGLNNYQHYSIQYAARLILEVYRKKDLRDEFKFTKRNAVAQDFFFRVLYNGVDVTNKLSFCKVNVVIMKVDDPTDGMKTHTTYLCPIENIVRFIHDDYFDMFNASNFKDACASYGTPKRGF